MVAWRMRIEASPLLGVMKSSKPGDCTSANRTGASAHTVALRRLVHAMGTRRPLPCPGGYWCTWWHMRAGGRACARAAAALLKRRAQRCVLYSLYDKDTCVAYALEQHAALCVHKQSARPPACVAAHQHQGGDHDLVNRALSGVQIVVAIHCKVGRPQCAVAAVAALRAYCSRPHQRQARGEQPCKRHPVRSHGTEVLAEGAAEMSSGYLQHEGVV